MILQKCAKVITGHWAISAENFKDMAAIVMAEITTTPGSWPSIPLAPILSMFMIKTIQKSPNSQEENPYPLPFPQGIKNYLGGKIDDSSAGFEIKKYRFRRIWGQGRQETPGVSLKYGFKLYLSSKIPTKVIRADQQNSNKMFI